MSFVATFNKQMLINYGAGLSYYIEKHKLMEIISRLLAEIIIAPVDDPRQWLGENIKRIARELYTRSLEQFYRGEQTKFYKLPRNFVLRVVIFGKPGSGRHSLLEALARRHNVVEIDADVLLYHKINAPVQDDLSRQFQDALEADNVYMKSEAAGKIIEQRLLKEDALRRGWVLINYPNNACEARYLFDCFTVPPNRFVYLKCPEHLAKARIVTKPFRSSPQTNFTYIERQMQQYRKSRPCLNEYLASRREVIYLNTKPCFEEVKIQFFSELSRVPYLLGYKFGMSE